MRSFECHIRGQKLASSLNASCRNLVRIHCKQLNCAREKTFCIRTKSRSQSLTFMNVLPEPHCPLSIHQVLSSFARSSFSLNSSTASVIRSLHTAAENGVLQQLLLLIITNCCSDRRYRCCHLPNKVENIDPIRCTLQWARGWRQ